MKATSDFSEGNCNKGTQVQAKKAAKQSTEQDCLKKFIYIIHDTTDKPTSTCRPLKGNQIPCKSVFPLR